MHLLAYLYHEAAHLVERQFPLSSAARVHRRVDPLDDFGRNVVAREGLDQLEHAAPGRHDRLVHRRAIQPAADRIEALPVNGPVVVALLGLGGAGEEAPALAVARVHRDLHHDGGPACLVLLLGDHKRAARTVGEGERHDREGQADHVQIHVEPAEPVVEEPAALGQREVLSGRDGAHDRLCKGSARVAGGGELFGGGAERALDLGSKAGGVHRVSSG